MDINIIVAMDENNGIGFQGNLLQRIKDDMIRFKHITQNNIVVMGRKTFESLPNGALKDRINIVLTRDESYKAANALVSHSKDELMQLLKYFNNSCNVYIIGGAEIYKLFENDCNDILVTRIHKKFENVDTFFTIDMSKWCIAAKCNTLIDEKSGVEHTFAIYTRIKE